MGRKPGPLDQAAQALRQEPLWLGSQYEGLPLERVERTTTERGRHSMTAVTGQVAADALACRARIRQTGGRSGEACDRVRQAGHSLVIRGDRVYSGRFARLQKDSVYVSIQASSESLALAAARALESVPH